MSEMEENIELINRARDAMKYAYAPYSGFKVGAAVLSEDGQIFSGCNVENVSFGATNCAERTAIFKAVSAGAMSFSKIAVVSSKGTKTFPCGICRQVLLEFMKKDGLVLLADGTGITQYKLGELVPYAFEEF